MVMYWKWCRIGIWLQTTTKKSYAVSIGVPVDDWVTVVYRI